METQKIWQFVAIFLAGLLIGFTIGKYDFSPFVRTNIVQTGEAMSINREIGKADAPITMVEFSDFQCPLCGKFFRENWEMLKNEYIDTGKVKYVFKHFPLSFHANAQPAALASDCALEQQKFWEMHDQLYRNQTEWSDQSDASISFRKYAEKLGLNLTQFNQCMESKKYQAAITSDRQEGQKNGISGTPTFIINGEKLIGAQDPADLKAFLEAKLQQN